MTTTRPRELRDREDYHSDITGHFNPWLGKGSVCDSKRVLWVTALARIEKCRHGGKILPLDGKRKFQAFKCLKSRHEPVATFGSAEDAYRFAFNSTCGGRVI